MKKLIRGGLFWLWLLAVVAVSVHAQGSKQKAAAPLEKTQWKLLWVSGAKIDTATPRQLPYFQLDPESHRVSGSGGCNRLTGGYELSGASLRFTQMAMTRMACLHGGDTESHFVQALDEAKTWKIVSGRLLLIDADQHVVAKFSAYTPET
jgi:heat shock protein HslJ